MSSPSTSWRPARYHANGKIGLRFTRAGFGTPFFGADEQVRVAADGVAVIRGDDVVVHPFTTPADVARQIGIEPGAPTEVYTPTTPLDPDAHASGRRARGALHR